MIEERYFWVRCLPDGEWEPAALLGDMKRDNEFWLTGSEWGTPVNLFEVGPELIPPPQPKPPVSSPS